MMFHPPKEYSVPCRTAMMSVCIAVIRLSILLLNITEICYTDTGSQLACGTKAVRRMHEYVLIGMHIDVTTLLEVERTIHPELTIHVLAPLTYITSNKMATTTWLAVSQRRRLPTDANR